MLLALKMGQGAKTQGMWKLKEAKNPIPSQSLQKRAQLHQYLDLSLVRPMLDVRPTEVEDHKLVVF